MSHAQPHPPFRVQIICESALNYFKNINLSVRHYAFTRGRMELVENWNSSHFSDLAITASPFYHPGIRVPMNQGKGDLAEHVRKHRIDGIIAQVKDRAMADELKALPVPVIDIGARFSDLPFPTVTQDYKLVGRQAAEHLIDCGAAVFAFWGQKDAVYSTMMYEAFVSTINKARPHAKIFKKEGLSILDESGKPLVQKMEKWLKKLRSPLGIFSVADTFALHLMQAAQNLGLRIPEDVALLSSADDPYWVEFGNIPLSSIRYNPRGIGIQAAELLDKMMSKGLRQAPSQYVAGSTVSARRSTDVLFIEDMSIAKAVAYIRKNTNKNIYVADVVKASGVSRTGLHLRFKESLGRSVLDEIRNSRIRHVQMLLRTSDLQLTEIAELCDFPDTPALHVMFRRITGKTPAKYRAAFRHL